MDSERVCSMQIFPIQRLMEKRPFRNKVTDASNLAPQGVLCRNENYPEMGCTVYTVHLGLMHSFAKIYYPHLVCQFLQSIYFKVFKIEKLNILYLHLMIHCR